MGLGDFAVYILAGGEGRRFGGDKLLALVDGSTTVSRIASVAWGSGASGVYAVTRSEEKCKLYSLEARLTGCLYDAGMVPGGGPADGFYTAISHAYSLGFKRAIILSGDAPWVTPSVIAWLYSSLYLAPAATIVHENGFIESLMAGIDTGTAETQRVLELALKMAGVRGYGRPCDYLRLSRRVALVGSALVAYTATVFADINTRENLRMRASKNRLGERGITVFTPLLREGLEAGGASLCRVFRLEDELYTRLGLLHFKLKALTDYQNLCVERKPGA